MSEEKSPSKSAVFKKIFEDNPSLAESASNDQVKELFAKAMGIQVADIEKTDMGLLSAAKAKFKRKSGKAAKKPIENGAAAPSTNGHAEDFESMFRKIAREEAEKALTSRLASLAAPVA